MKKKGTYNFFPFLVCSYYRPHPRCVIDKELEICTLHLPKSCPIQTITVHGKTKILKQLACLEACRKLHQVGALTDNLVPDIVGAEADAEEFGNYLFTLLFIMILCLEFSLVLLQTRFSR